jgi:hypothetical protein
VPVHLPNSNPNSHPGHMLSPVPPGILPCSPVDGPDFRCLNHGHAPLPNPLKRHLNIEQHNEVWFSYSPAHPPSYPIRATQPAVLIDTIDDSLFPSLASMDNLPAVAIPSSLAPAPAPQPAALASALASSSDKLFFASHLPAGTARPRWCLVRVDSALTAADPDCLNARTSGIYHIQFLLQHPSDKSLSHPRSRWWPLHRCMHAMRDSTRSIGLNSTRSIGLNSIPSTRSVTDTSLLLVATSRSFMCVLCRSPAHPCVS